MLLLMVESEDYPKSEFIPIFLRNGLNQPMHLLIDMGAILINFPYCGTGQQTALRPRMHHTVCVVVAIKEVIELWAKGPVRRIEMTEHKGFEKPTHMGDMPLGRACLDNGLDLIVIMLKGQAEGLGKIAYSVELSY
jgi:hypothetical protein